MAEFLDLAGARTFLNKIKDFLETEDWLQDGDYYTYRKRAVKAPCFSYETTQFL